MPDSSGVSIQDIMTSIQTSQDTEKELIAKLDSLTSQPNYKVDSNILSIISSINSLSDSRIKLFALISDRSKILQTGVANSRQDLIAQLTLSQVVEDQLNQAKNAMASLQNRNDTQMRLVEINTYYGKRYAAQTKLMKLIILICIPLLILFILKKRGILPELISNYAIGITMAVGMIFVIRQLWDIYTRSNVDFDEYQWSYESPASQTPTVWQYNKEHLFNFDNPIKNLMGNLGLCVGSNCCANGMYFDETKQQCTIQSVAGGSHVESFVSGGLNGSSITNVDKKDEMQNGITPYSDKFEYSYVQ